MDKNGQELAGMDKNGQEWTRKDKNGQNGQEWTKLDKGLKNLQVQTTTAVSSVQKPTAYVRVGLEYTEKVAENVSSHVVSALKSSFFRSSRFPSSKSSIESHKE
jgi:hypothetical protein